MFKFFNPDNPIMQFISKVFDLIILNILFIVTCIPVFTIGASLSAMYYVTLKIVRKDDEDGILLTYWKGFKNNFKQGTIIWLIFLAIFALLGLDFNIVSVQSSTSFTILKAVLIAISIFLFSMFLYVFPIISHFVCSVTQAFKNSALMTIAHLPYTVLLFLLYGGIFWLFTRSAQMLIMGVTLTTLLGYSLIALISSVIFGKIFRNYEPKESDEEKPAEEV